MRTLKLGEAASALPLAGLPSRALRQVLWCYRINEPYPIDALQEPDAVRMHSMGVNLEDYGRASTATNRDCCCPIWRQVHVIALHRPKPGALDGLDVHSGRAMEKARRRNLSTKLKIYSADRVALIGSNRSAIVRDREPLLVARADNLMQLCARHVDATSGKPGNQCVDGNPAVAVQHDAGGIGPMAKHPRDLFAQTQEIRTVIDSGRRIPWKAHAAS